MQQDINEVSSEIDELTELLRDTHIREGVLKARLNRAIERKIHLVEQQRDPGNQGQQQPPFAVEAVIIEDEVHSLISATHRHSPSVGNRTRRTTSGNSNSSPRSNATTICNDENNGSIVRDRDGVVLSIGDEVRFLTKGSNPACSGEISKFTRKYVVCIDSSGTFTRRYSRNLRVIQKFHEC